MSDIAVFAFRREFKPICTDARLEGTLNDRGFTYPLGDSKGQAGWNLAFEF